MIWVKIAELMLRTEEGYYYQKILAILLLGYLVLSPIITKSSSDKHNQSIKPKPKAKKGHIPVFLRVKRWFRINNQRGHSSDNTNHEKC